MLPAYPSKEFSRLAKRLHAKDKEVLDAAVKTIMEKPHIGMEKAGDLTGVFVYKFKMNKQERLLAYVLEPDKLAPAKIYLVYFGPHENFYRDLKQDRKH